MVKVNFGADVREGKHFPLIAITQGESTITFYADSYVETEEAAIGLVREIFEILTDVGGRSNVYEMSEPIPEEVN